MNIYGQAVFRLLLPHRTRLLLISFHPETPDVKLLVSESENGFFSPGKKIKGLRGGVHGYAAQARPKIDAARGKKHPFRTETNYMSALLSVVKTEQADTRIVRTPTNNNYASRWNLR